MAELSSPPTQPPGQSDGAPVDFNALIQLAKERAAQVAAGKIPTPSAAPLLEGVATYHETRGPMELASEIYYVVGGSMHKRPREDEPSYGYGSDQPETKRPSAMSSWYVFILQPQTRSVSTLLLPASLLVVRGTGANAPMTAGLGAQNQDVIELPNHAVGIVIGKGGDNIKRIQSQSGARVQIAPGMPGSRWEKALLEVISIVLRANRLVRRRQPAGNHLW